MPSFYLAVRTVSGNSSTCLALLLDLHWAAHRCRKVQSLLLPSKELFAVNSSLKEKTVCQVSQGKAVCGYQFARAWPKRNIKQSVFKAAGWKTNALCPRGTVSPPCPPAPVTNLCWRMGRELVQRRWGRVRGGFGARELSCAMQRWTLWQPATWAGKPSRTAPTLSSLYFPPPQ